MNEKDKNRFIAYKKIVSFKAVSKPLDAFIFQLKHDKPKEIWHSMYSSEVPCYYITEYLQEGVMIYAHAQAPKDRVPYFKTYKNLQREFEIQNIESFYYNPQTKPTNT